MAKSATEEKSSKGGKKDKERYLPMEKSPLALRTGDFIVTSLNPDGSVSHSFKILQIERGHGCGNVHINRSSCYHRHVRVQVSVKESDLEQMVRLMLDSDAEFQSRVDAIVEQVLGKDDEESA